MFKAQTQYRPFCGSKSAETISIYAMGVLSGEAADGHSPEQIVETATCADENRPTAVSSNEKKIFDSWRWTLVRIGIFSANFIYGLDTTIAAAIQAEAANDLGGLPQVGYLGAGFALGSAAAILPIGKAYGLFNMKWLFIGSLTMFAAGSALCGGAPSMVALIVGRVWAGVGGAGVYLGYGSTGSSFT